MSQRLFVYGTLMNGMEANVILASKGARYVGSGVIQGRLYDLGEYPAAVKSDDPNEVVVGELYELPDLAALRGLDAYEEFEPDQPDGSVFIREEVTVRMPEERGREVRAWAYFYNPALQVRGARRISSGDYRAARIG
ncbi:MAG TPA: gamma-glutamylcyclotransferase family protein [Dehalococcoidia bacterium]|nr:gamma-glutamylcyclotransferase family protein [Dehalococcoidia bacterium]